MTLDEIEARCKKVGDCWVWMGGQIRQRPYMSIRVEGKRVNLRVQKEVLEASGNKVHPNSPIEQSCGVRLCCNPEHQIVQAAPGRLGFMQHQKGNPFAPLLWSAR